MKNLIIQFLPLLSRRLVENGREMGNNFLPEHGNGHPQNLRGRIDGVNSRQGVKKLFFVILNQARIKECHPEFISGSGSPDALNLLDTETSSA
jgi:hypothetical protein